MRKPSLPEWNEHGRRSVGDTVRAVMARRVLQARSAMALSRRELARRAGVAPQTVSRIERGEQMPRPETIAKLKEVLGEI